MPRPTKRRTPAARAAARPAPALPPVIAPGAAAAAVAGTPAKDGPARKDKRSEELRIKVTEAVRQRFKQTAKELGVKKGALLEQLLAVWHARHPEDGRAGKLAQDSTAAAIPAVAKAAPATKRRPRGA